ncbi:helix-turn-helix domain-containing protein [Altererythrobacter sp. B11]|uniref:helix-turn-helix domain-containing protein n=1 Tax=Altererythrobacter sp. B11 TaxID=2060312 RepID=UPI000E5B7220
MGLGDRIEERLSAIGMTQAELARRVGVRQSTMNSLIRGNSRSSRSLVQIARELRTTPAYLTGETDDPSAAHTAFEINAQERDLLEALRCLNSTDRASVFRHASALAATASSTSSLHDKQHTYRGQGE